MTLKDGLLTELSDADRLVMRKLSYRVNSIRPIQQMVWQWSDRADQLYYPEEITQGGADLWPNDPSATTAGRAHVSINSMSAYVDIPAALQAVEPIENFLATKDSDSGRHAATAVERMYEAWKREQDYDLKYHKAMTVKGLYGLTAANVRLHQDQDGQWTPKFDIIEQPRHLYLGYKTDDYTHLEWGAYVTYWEPNSLVEEFGVDIVPFETKDGFVLPLVQQRDWTDPPARPWLAWGDARVEVWDYWYRQPVWKGKKFVRMDTYNVILAGNFIISGPDKQAAYKGELPWLPLFNTFVPGLPMGRPDLYDVEPLLREKMELVTAGSQMIHNAVGGDFWQIVGPDAPWDAPKGLKPTRNSLISPGPGNRIETITPYVAQFQLEQFLGRIDRETALVTGLNDLLIGLAPNQVLSSSKAINALISNFESRMAIRRRLSYQWRRAIWELSLKLWVTKDPTVAKIIANGGAHLDIVDPSLTPRDDMETATRAVNLMNAKAWSQRRTMNVVGVDDPEQEQDLIREERTDATMFPADVQVMAQLMSALQSLGLNAPQNAQSQAQGMATNGQADLRKALGAQTPDNTNAAQAPDQQGQTPPMPGASAQGGGGPGAPFAQGPNTPNPGTPGGPPVMQNSIAGGKLQPSRTFIKTQASMGRR